MCCGCGGGESWIRGTIASDVEDRCEDIPSVQRDAQNRSCVAYNASTCGLYDTPNFNSSELCCVCGGGVSMPYVDTISSVNSEGHTCFDISQLYMRGFDEICTTIFDTIDFTASDMCTACGGGQELHRDTFYQTPGEGTCDDSMWNDRKNRMLETCDDYNPSYCVTSTPSQDDSDFTASEMCCACGGGEIVNPPICVDSSFGALNSDGYSCGYIQQIVNGPKIDYGCNSNQDTPEFTATDMCCACGGGISWNRGSLESTSELRCEDKLDICDMFDASSCIVTDTFDPTDFCCVCGGGRTVRYFDRNRESQQFRPILHRHFWNIKLRWYSRSVCCNIRHKQLYRVRALYILWRGTTVCMFT